jgi:hypothetical protein
MTLVSLAFHFSSVGNWVGQFLVWFLIWTPVVALLEYATHRWIMHMANRLLDSRLGQFRAHLAHHQGANNSELVDMPWRNCLLLASPLLLGLAIWGLSWGRPEGIVIPGAALLAWTMLYAYLWTRIHRAIHGVERNWLRRNRRLFRFYRDHHLRHHVNAAVNYGTVFPWTDYLFFTRHRPASTPRRLLPPVHEVGGPQRGVDNGAPFHSKAGMVQSSV